MKVITSKIYSVSPARKKKRNGQSCKHSSSLVSDSNRVANTGDCQHFKMSGDSCRFLELYATSLGARQVPQLIY